MHIFTPCIGAIMTCELKNTVGMISIRLKSNIDILVKVKYRQQINDNPKKNQQPYNNPHGNNHQHLRINVHKASLGGSEK